MKNRLSRSHFTVALAIATLAAGADPVHATNSTWVPTTTFGSWQTPANWSPATVPNTIGDVANVNNNIVGSGTITLDGAVTLGTLNLGDTNNTGTFTLATGASGTLTMNNGGSGAQINEAATAAGDVISAPIVLADNLTVNNAAASKTLTISGPLSGAGNLTKTGAGTLALQSANTFNGTTTIAAGTLAISNAMALGLSTSAILLGDTSGSANTGLTLSGATNLSRNITLQSGNTGTATITTGSGASTYTGTLTLGSAGGTGHSVTLSSSAAASNGGFTGVIQDPTGLVGAGGVVTLNETFNINFFGNGNSTYSGGAIINGTSTTSPSSNTYLSFNNGHIFGTGNVTINAMMARQTSNGGSVISGANTQTWNGDWYVNGGSGGTLNWAMTGNIDLGSLASATTGVANANNATRTLSLTGAMALGGAMTDGSNGITKNFALSSSTTQILTLNAVSTYSGSTTVAGGQIRLGNGNNRLPTTTVLTLGNGTSSTTPGGSLDLNGFSQTLAGLASGTGVGAKSVVLDTGGASTLTIANTGSNQYDGLITGNVALVKNSAGTETLTGSHSFSGGTTVNGGTLIVSGGTTSVAASTQTGTAASGYNTSTGYVTITGLSSTAGLAVGQTVTNANIPAGAVITAINSSTSVTISSSTTGAISNGSITFGAYNGSGLGSGAVTLNSGKLVVNSAVAGAVTVNSTATLAGTGSTGAVTMNGTGAIDLADSAIGTLTIGGLSTSTSGGSLTFEIGGTTTAADSILDSGALTINGVTTLNVGYLNGTTQSLANGSYQLLSYGSGSASLSDFSLVTTGLGTTQSYSLSQTGNTIYLVVANAGTPTTSPYFNGTSGNLNLASAYDTGLATGTVTTSTPGAASNLNFSATRTPVSTGTVTSALEVNSMNFGQGGTTTSFTVNGTAPITIDATSANGNTASSGITIAANGGNATINAPVVLGNDQKWTPASASSTLTVNGTVSGAHQLTTAGAGTTILTGANTYSGGTVVSSGKLYANNAGATSATGTGSVTVQGGGTLGGSGRITGAVTVQSGGTLASGAAQNLAGHAVDGTHLTLTSDLFIAGGGNLTFALGAVGDTGTGPGNFASPDLNSTYLHTGGMVTFDTDSSHGAVNINLVDLTVGSTTDTLQLRFQNPYLLIADSSNSNLSYNLVTDHGYDQNGYVLGIGSAGTGNSILNTINITMYDVNGNAIGSSTNYQNLKLYLYNGQLEVVPEPGTWALMLGGWVVLVLIQRRRSKVSRG